MIFAGTTIVVVVSVVSSVVLLALGIAIGIYIWKHRNIQKKRRGENLFLEICGSLRAILLILYHSKGSRCLHFMEASECVIYILKISL